LLSCRRGTESSETARTRSRLLSKRRSTGCRSAECSGCATKPAGRATEQRARLRRLLLRLSESSKSGRLGRLLAEQRGGLLLLLLGLAEASRRGWLTEPSCGRRPKHARPRLCDRLL
jgi:hypothetical protein